MRVLGVEVDESLASLAERFASRQGCRQFTRPTLEHWLTEVARWPAEARERGLNLFVQSLAERVLLYGRQCGLWVPCGRVWTPAAPSPTEKLHGDQRKDTP